MSRNVCQIILIICQMLCVIVMGDAVETHKFSVVADAVSIRVILRVFLSLGISTMQVLYPR